MASVALDLLKAGGLSYPEPRTVLIAGAGPERMPEWEENGFIPAYQDIEPRTNPDILGNMTEFPKWLTGHFDIIFCCHALEHVYPHEVQWVLSEFKRVLRPGGIAMILVPDLEDVRPTEEILYTTGSGPYCGLQLYYGDFREIQQFPHMAHHCGFVKETLKKALLIAGFDKVETSRLPNYNLYGVGFKAA
jgi:predicted SAM-dependent methyltransferase